VVEVSGQLGLTVICRLLAELSFLVRRVPLKIPILPILSRCVDLYPSAVIEISSLSVVLSTQIDKPILRMPTLAIHLDRTVNDKLAYNPETQMVPILALASKELSKAFVDENRSSAEVSFADPLDITSHHHPILLHLIAQNLSESTGESIAPHQIHDFELSLYDTREFFELFVFLFSHLSSELTLVFACTCRARNDRRCSRRVRLCPSMRQSLFDVRRNRRFNRLCRILFAF